jgi:hypothetical protein
MKPHSREKGPQCGNDRATGDRDAITFVIQNRKAGVRADHDSRIDHNGGESSQR